MLNPYQLLPYARTEELLESLHGAGTAELTHSNIMKNAVKSRWRPLAQAGLYRLLVHKKGSWEISQEPFLKLND